MVDSSKDRSAPKLEVTRMPRGNKRKVPSIMDIESQHIPQSHSCYSHSWPYFKTPVHPYDYSEDWDLDEEWNKRQGRRDSERLRHPDTIEPKN